MAEQEPVPITGVWVHRSFDHLGGGLEVMVEVDGVWRTVQQHSGPEHGYISHITEAAGIRAAPPADQHHQKDH